MSPTQESGETPIVALLLSEKSFLPLLCCGLLHER